MYQIRPRNLSLGECSYCHKGQVVIIKPYGFNSIMNKHPQWYCRYVCDKCRHVYINRTKRIYDNIHKVRV